MIEPLGHIIQLKVDEARAGVLDTSSRASAVEYGEVLAVGEDVKLKVKKGDKVFFKSWACDLVAHEDKRYVFINEESGGILAVVKEGRHPSDTDEERTILTEVGA